MLIHNHSFVHILTMEQTHPLLKKRFCLNSCDAAPATAEAKASFHQKIMRIARVTSKRSLPKNQGVFPRRFCDAAQATAERKQVFTRKLCASQERRQNDQVTQYFFFVIWSRFTSTSSLCFPALREISASSSSPRIPSFLISVSK